MKNNHINKNLTRLANIKPTTKKNTMKNSNLSQVLDIALKNKGVTYSLALGQINPKFGYMVSRKGSELKAEKLDKNTTALYVKSQAEALANPENYLGIWYDENSGFWFLDVSTNVADLNEAIILGDKNEQLAIYDCTNQRVINMPKTAFSKKETAKHIMNGEKEIYIFGHGYLKLPSPQKAGTEYQKQTYASMTAYKLWQSL